MAIHTQVKSLLAPFIILLQLPTASKSESGVKPGQLRGGKVSNLGPEFDTWVSFLVQPQE